MKRIKSLVNKLKSKLDDKAREETPLGYIGSIDEVTKNKVRGWVALSNKMPIVTPITLKVNELSLELPELSFRDDLQAHGIANGIAAFDVEFESGDYEKLDVAVYVGQEKVLFSRALLGNDNIKNKDPYFINFYNKSISKNQSSRLNDGLNIQLVQSSEYEKSICSGFFYRISNAKTSKQKTIVIGQSLVQGIYSNDIIELILNTNKAAQVLVELLDNEQIVIASSRLEISPGWNTYTTPLSCFNFDLIEGASSILLTLYIDSSSYIDLGGLLVKNSNEKNLVSKPKFEKLKTNQESISIINSSLSNCKLPREFIKLRRKNLIAPGVIYEAKDGNKSEFIAAKSDSGISINIGKLLGYSRIVYSLDLKNIKSMPMQGKITATGDCNKLIKSVYIYAKGAQEKILNKLRLSCQKLEDDRYEWIFILDYNSICDLINTTSDYHEYRLAVEFNANNQADDFSVSLHQQTSFKKEEVFSAIEDPAIASQLDIIAGYYDVLKRNPTEVKTDTVNVKKSKYSPVDIVIPVYNAKEFVIECLESIIKHTNIAYRILLVDDCSTDGISDVLDEYADKYDFISVHHQEQNVGYTANVNKGFELAVSEWVLLLNSDTVVTPFWLENLLEGTTKDKVAIIGPLGNAASWQSVPNVLSKNGGWDFNLIPAGLTPNDIAFQLNLNRQYEFADAGVLNGFCQLINRELFFEVGKLDEIAFPKGYGEENDLCARLIERGYRLLVCPNSYVYHHKSKSFGHDIRTELSEKGSVALKKKHPDYNWGLVSKKLYNHDVLVKARQTIAPLYEV